MKNLIKIVAPILMLAAGGGVAMMLDWAKPEPEKKKETSHAPSLMVGKVTRRDMILMISTQAEVKANIEVDLVTQLGGLIKAVSAEYIEGGRFDKGVPLLWIDDSDYQLALKRTQARLAEANVRLKQVEADAEVARLQLINTKNPSALALKKPQIAEANANLIAAEADMSLARLNLSRTRISLPFKGRLKSIQTNVGQYVIPGSVLARGFATNKVKLRLPLTDQQLAYLDLPIGFVASKNNAPRVDFKAVIAGKERVWQGKLTRIDASFDEQSRLLYALAEVENPYDAKLSMPMAVGLYVSADIYGRTVDQALIIPRSALRSGNKVYLVDDKKRLDIKTVQVIYKSIDSVVIQSDLEVGQSVVISAVRDPIQGMAVLVINQDAPEITGQEKG